MTVNFWQSESGKSPVADFIRDLAGKDARAASRVAKDIEFLETRGLDLLSNTDRARELKGYKNLYELKSIIKGVYIRILFCVIDGECWMLEAFKKKSNHTPERFIKTAIARRDSISRTHHR